MDPTAVIGRRIAAWILDLLWIGLLLGLVVVPTVLTQTSRERVPLGETAAEYCAQSNVFCSDSNPHVTADGDVTVGVAPLWTLALIPLALATVFVSLVALEAKRGGSPGKLVVGLRVVDGQGQLAGFRGAFLRNLLRVVDNFICLGLVGFVMILAANGHRRVGDFAGGTYVVDKSYVGSPVVTPPAGYPPAGYPPPSASSTGLGNDANPPDMPR